MLWMLSKAWSAPGTSVGLPTCKIQKIFCSGFPFEHEWRLMWNFRPWTVSYNHSMEACGLSWSYVPSAVVKKYLKNRLLACKISSAAFLLVRTCSFSYFTDENPYCFLGINICNPNYSFHGFNGGLAKDRRYGSEPIWFIQINQVGRCFIWEQRAVPELAQTIARIQCLKANHTIEATL